MAHRIALCLVGAVLSGALAAAQAPSPKKPASEPAGNAAPAAPRPEPAAATKPAGAPPSAAQPVAQTPPPATPPTTDPLAQPPGFAYNAEGRRDPFVSLLRRASTARTGAATLRPAGLGGLSVDEITLRGTLRNRETFVGIAQGADQKTYIVRAGDKLLDGMIRTISQNDMVIVQQVNDPLSLEKQREVRKVLRQIEAK